MASATELVIAFVMGAGGSILYAWDGYVDIRLAMIILAGSLFGVQIGAIGTTYVKDWVVKLIMAIMMLIVLVSRFFKVPVYLSDLGLITTISAELSELLSTISFGMLALALFTGAGAILVALLKGMAQHRRESAELNEAVST